MRITHDVYQKEFDTVTVFWMMWALAVLLAAFFLFSSLYSMGVEFRINSLGIIPIIRSPIHQYACILRK